jgi:hypothetical protein
MFLVPSAVGVTLTQVDRFTDHFTYTASTTDERFSINENGTYSLVYTGSQSKSSAYRVFNEIIDQHIMSIDNLVMTNYTSSSYKFVSTLISKIKTGKLYFPEPQTENELFVARDLATLLSTFGTELEFYKVEEEIQIGGYEFNLHYSMPMVHSGNPSTAFTLSTSDNSYTYLSRGLATEDEALARRVIMTPIEKSIIFGANGFGANDDNLDLAQAVKLIKGIYYSSSHPLSYKTLQYFRQNKVPITKIGTSFFILC